MRGRPRRNRQTRGVRDGSRRRAYVGNRELRIGGTPPAADEDGAGTLPTGSPDFVYVPVEVPSGVRELHVSYTYDRPAVPAGTAGNALDIGLFDERGTELGGRGFRGWSGGARTEFFVRADDATPGYLPGPVRPGPGTSRSARTRWRRRACRTRSRSR